MDETTAGAGERRSGPDALEAYLHEHIPLSRAMEVRVERADGDAVVLSAPLAANINHQDTAFGGSVSALAILAGWALVHVRLAAGPGHGRIVIQRNQIEYLAPMVGRFRARATAPEAGAWSRFLRMLERKGVGRVEVTAEVTVEGTEEAGARLRGQYVAMEGEDRRDGPRAPSGAASPGGPRARERASPEAGGRS